VDDHERGGLLGLTLGIALGLWSTVGDGGIGVGVFAVLIIVGSVIWLGVVI
jgi:hypothetical protein